MGDWDRTKNLMNELTQGRELAQQLQIHLNSPSSSHETRGFLAQKILESYQTSISIIKSSEENTRNNTISMQESPQSHSGESDQELKDAPHKNCKKTIPTWKQQIRVTPGFGLEGPLDDGFSWRKYGQKDILGAKFPRGYYRCTHRHVQGCLATKQVQRSDEDPTTFEITYRGRHTCTQASNANLGHPPAENQEPNNNTGTDNNPQELANLRKDLRVITQDLDIHEQQQPFSSFHIPSSSNTTPAGSNPYLPHMVDSIGMFVSGFGSAETSGTNYNLSVSPRSVQGIDAHFQNYSESEITHEIIVSAAASTTNSPTVGLDFPFGNAGLDPNFTFGNPGGFFS